eukprot:6740635-Alexandrium_andersonii.AAC.1
MVVRARYNLAALHQWAVPAGWTPACACSPSSERLQAMHLGAQFNPRTPAGRTPACLCTSG